jgi:hypothetical protein
LSTLFLIRQNQGKVGVFRAQAVTNNHKNLTISAVLYSLNAGNSVMFVKLGIIFFIDSRQKKRNKLAEKPLTAGGKRSEIKNPDIDPGFAK